jgi:hypothetical protein
VIAETNEGVLIDCVRREVAGATFRESELPLSLSAPVRQIRVILSLLGPGKAWFGDVRIEAEVEDETLARWRGP